MTEDSSELKTVFNNIGFEVFMAASVKTAIFSF